MGPKTGSIQVTNHRRSGWLAHMPLWVVVGLGALVMFASEAPEAARSPVGRMAVGEISIATQQYAGDRHQFQMPGTLTDLGTVPASSRIGGYRDELALAKIVPQSRWQSWEPAVAMRKMALKQNDPDTEVAETLAEKRRQEISQLIEAVDAFNLVGQDNAHRVTQAEAREAKLIETLIANIDMNGDTIADEMTGSSDLIDLRHRQHKIADFLARYYRRSKDKIRRYVRFAYESAQRNGVDPLLIVGIMCVESSLNSRATSNKGAKGLMQVLVRVHKKRFKPFGGTKNAYDPRTSVEVGTRIIAGMIARTGSVKKALKHYVGAANFRSDAGYGNKVIGMRDRVWAASLGKRIPARPNMKIAIRRAEFAQSKFKATIVTASR